MILLFEAGAYRVMCKYVQLKGNVYYYRCRVPEDVRSLHKRLGRGPQEQLFFSLKASDKAEACRRADSHTRRLDALWKSHRDGYTNKADVLAALATLELAGFNPGDAIRYTGPDQGQGSCTVHPDDGPDACPAVEVELRRFDGTLIEVEGHRVI